MTPMEYIESIYEKQGFKVVCKSVAVEVNDCVLNGRSFDGTFTLVGCKINPKDLLEVEGIQFLNFYADNTEVKNLDGVRYKVPTGLVEFCFCSKGGGVAAGLLQCFVSQFSNAPES